MRNSARRIGPSFTLRAASRAGMVPARATRSHARGDSRATSLLELPRRVPLFARRGAFCRFPADHRRRFPGVSRTLRRGSWPAWRWSVRARRRGKQTRWKWTDGKSPHCQRSHRARHLKRGVAGSWKMRSEECQAEAGVATGPRSTCALLCTPDWPGLRLRPGVFFLSQAELGARMAAKAARFRVINRTREEDERDLAILEQCRRGASVPALAKQFGVKATFIWNLCRAVAEADRAVPDPRASAQDYARAYR